MLIFIESMAEVKGHYTCTTGLVLLVMMNFFCNGIWIASLMLQKKLFFISSMLQSLKGQ